MQAPPWSTVPLIIDLQEECYNNKSNTSLFLHNIPIFSSKSTLTSLAILLFWFTYYDLVHIFKILLALMVHLYHTHLYTIKVSKLLPNIPMLPTSVSFFFPTPLFLYLLRYSQFCNSFLVLSILLSCYCICYRKVRASGICLPPLNFT